jgi:4-diphosphocytidyl-2-C-methyl-D-erythritol kinase
MISLCDTLRLEKSAAGIELTCDSETLPTDDRNLVRQALKLALVETGSTYGVKAHLQKRIPVGAGLGGGSSDAAASLLGVNRLLGLGMSQKKLIELARLLGSDVPLFLSGGQCLISGRGEIVEDVVLPMSYKIILIVPDFSVSTAWAYSALRFPLTMRGRKPTFLAEGEGRDFYRSLSNIGNDFVGIVVHKHPDVAGVLERLRRAGAQHVELTGTGSAFYGLFDRVTGLEEESVLEDRSGWRMYELSPIRRENIP